MTQSPHVISELYAALDVDERQLVDFVRSRGGTPLVDGSSATFVFVGQAEEVILRHWMDTFPPIPPFRRVEGTDVWLLTMGLPEAARVEYKLAIRRHGRRRLYLDPMNHSRADEPAGLNTLACGSAYRRPLWSRRDPAVPAGRLETIEVESEVFGESRTIGVYRPSIVAEAPLPLLVVHDGSDYRDYAALTAVLDNLIAAGDIPPLAAALLDPDERTVEYAADRRHAGHLVTEVIPAVAAVVDIDADRMFALGASLGGVASLHASWMYPGTFAGLILQSGSFVTALGGPFHRGPVFKPVVAFLHEMGAAPGSLPGVMHLSCGQYDGLHADCLAMAHQLSDGGVDVGWEDALDGHHWENWRDRLRSGLVHVLAAERWPSITPR